MRDEARSRQASHRRVEILTRGDGLIQAALPLAAGQALAPYLSSRRGSVSLTDTVGSAGGERLDHVTLRQAEIVWARPLDSDTPLVNVPPLERENLPVEVVLSGGVVLRGRFPMLAGQSISDYLGAMGLFPVLWAAHVADSAQALGDVAVNQQAIHSVRDVSGVSTRAEWVRGSTSPGRTHWLVRTARQLGHVACEALVTPPDVAIVEAWHQVCATAGITEDDLAAALSRHLRLRLVSADELTGDVVHEVPEPLLERFGVRVVSWEARELVVATADPMNADAEQSLAFACKRRVSFAIATPRDLQLHAPRREPELEELLRNSRLGADAVSVEKDVEPDEVQVDEVSAEPIIRLANLILREAVRQKASDIHLEPDQGRGIVRFRIDGMLRPYMHIPLNALHRVISRYKVMAKLDIANRVRPQDGSVRIRVEGRAHELRLSTVPTQDAEKAVIRIAGSVQEQTLEQLAIPAPELQRLRQLLGFRDGIIVVTGPTGSGKTTTLYGALNELNTGKVNIMTVEDPIERALSGVTQMQVQPRRGVTFASALRAILRQDPDVILLGEIRDLETAEIAVQAAMTGHLVLTTLHTTSAVGVVARLRDLGLDASSLASSLRGVVAQRLARRICPNCAASGCELCGGTGYNGRLPLMEVLTTTPLFSELVGRGALFHDLQLAAEHGGMRPIRVVAEEAVAAGLTTRTEIARVLGDEEPAARPAAPPVGAAVDGALLSSGDARLLGDGECAEADFEIEDAAPSEVAALPALRSSEQAEGDASARRAQLIRSLLQGIDRCAADGQPLGDVLGFACEQLANAFDSPLVWIATVAPDEPPLIRARAGACAPYVRDLPPDWSVVADGDGAVATALRSASPQGRRLDEEPGFESWIEHARAHAMALFLVIPMVSDGAVVGLIGMHTRGVAGLDRSAGTELLSVSDRLAGVVQRLGQLETVGVQLSALELAADAVFLTDRRGVIAWVNRSFSALSGYAAQEAIGSTPRILRSDRQDDAFYRDLWQTIMAGRPWRGELYNLRRDGTSYAVEQTITPVIDDDGAITHFLSVQRDISERRQREESVRLLVGSDSLTGLPNARAFDAELSARCAAAADGAEEATLLLINIDGAAAVTELEGVAAGEALVREVAAVLSATLRPADYLARLGDCEFAALLPCTGRQGALIAADRLRDAMAGRTPTVDAAAGSPVSLAIGIAVVDGTRSARAVMAMADAALYGARDRGGLVVISNDESDDSLAQAGAQWAARITEALRDDHFFLHFQPVVRLSTRVITHYDALLRLHDGDGEVIPARVFIAHAEHLGLMPQLDRWVVENVMRLLQTSPDLRVSLNVSASTVTDSGFRQFLQRQSRRMAAVGNRIIFEVAEAAAAHDLPQMVDHMNRLRELGCRFALDNFGIGTASLASLGTLPVDYVKLDGSLIRGIDVDQQRHEIVRALATVARALGKEVIAGWAERESIAQLLPGLGIELAQGHHFGAPGPELRREPPAPAIDIMRDVVVPTLGEKRRPLIAV